MALKRIWMPSPNYSNRNSSVRLIVLHTAEGALTYQSLGNFFSSSSSGVSSHVGIDDTAGTIGEYVKRPNKAWTQANANPYSVAAELCAFAKWTPTDWAKHPVMLQNTAQWIAEEAAYFGIPITRLTASQAQDGRTKGVCQHVDLGAAGGGHWDCGPGFPMNDVINMAKGGSKPPEPTPPEFTGWEEDMIIQNGNTVYQLIYDGQNTYWRNLPAGAVAEIPKAQIIKDDGSLLGLWRTTPLK